MAQQLSTNTFGVAKWVVSADATQGTHTTIASAITSASSGETVWIRNGTYTENLTGKAGVTIRALSGLGSVTLVGKISMSAVGTFSVQDMFLQTNADNIATTTGASATAIIFRNCYMNCVNGTGLVVNSASGGMNLFNNIINVTPGQLFYTLTTGSMLLEQCMSDQTTGNSSTSSTMAAGLITIRNSCFGSPMTFSGGTANLTDVLIDQSATGVTPLTVAGATVNTRNCVFLGATASAINISSGTLNSFNDTIDSSNTNAVTGAGTINYSGMVFSGSSSKINTTTQTLGTYKGVQTNTTPAAGFIGEVMSASNSTGQVLASATVYNLTSITLTPGNWDITANAEFAATGTNTTNVSLYSAISTVNNSITPMDGHYGMGGGYDAGVGIINFNGATVHCKCGPCQVSISANTTYYLNVEEIAAVTINCTAYGTIRAIRTS